MSGEYPLGSSERPLRVAVVGSGPAGFYTAEALLKHRQVHTEVDLLERLPVPYGLVRFGVAPDHQKIKSVVRAYEKLAEHPRFRFLGNVRVCQGDLTVEELLSHYDQVVFTVGCETDRRLGIPGEDLSGSHPATSFVAWYNGHPDFRYYEVGLETERAAIIGVGDVAMDIARMLVRSVEDLATTDIADHALSVFGTSRVREVLVLGRRGPAQAAFAQKELQDIAELPDVDVIVDRNVIASALEQSEGLDGPSRRKLEYLATLPTEAEASAPKRVRLRFLASPVEIIGAGGRVTALKLEHNELVAADGGAPRARGTGEFETVPLGLVFRSVGYRGVPLEGLPFDDRAGILPNVEGRVTHAPGGEVWPRVYAAGWIKRGATGVIGTNKADAAATVAKMVEDIAGRTAPRSPERTRSAVDALLALRGVRVVSFDDWKRLDQLEVERGARRGKVRDKLTTVEEMLEALGR